MGTDTKTEPQQTPDHGQPGQAKPEPASIGSSVAEARPEPTEATPSRWRSFDLREELRFAGPIVALVLGIKLMVLSLGVVVVQTIGDREFTGLADRFAIWNAWDAPHYLDIARDGYVTSGDAANWIVFFPGYPYAVRFLDAVFPGDLLTAAFVVSGITSVSAALLLAYLVRVDTGDAQRAKRAAWFLLIFPTAYFLHIPYTESFFLTLVLGSFVAARTGRWGVAGVVGALAAVTRINGAILIPALMIEAYLQYRRTGRVSLSWGWIGLIGVGTLIYLGINQQTFGDPFHFQMIQEAKWSKSLADPYTSITTIVDSIKASGQGQAQMLLQELVFLTIGVVTVILAFIWSRPSYAVWALLNMMLFASTSWIQSTPRYVITVFPIFLLLAQIQRPNWRWIISAWSLGMMAWFTTLFALGRWAF